MTYKICYWDSEAREQKERDATPEEVAEIESRKNAPPPVPERVTMRQGRLALLQAGLLSQVSAAIDSLTGEEKQAALIEWEYSSAIERRGPFVQNISAALGLTSDAVDALFVQAQTL